MRRAITLSSKTDTGFNVKVTVEVDTNRPVERYDMNNKVNSLASEIMKVMGESSVCPYLSEIKRR